MINITPNPSHIQKHKQVSWTSTSAHIKSTLRGTCQNFQNKGLSPCPRKYLIQQDLGLIWTITWVGALHNLQVFKRSLASPVPQTLLIYFVMWLSAIVMSPEALLSRSNIETAETIEGQLETCLFEQERGSLMPPTQENGKYETEGQYSSPSQYRLTGRSWW